MRTRDVGRFVCMFVVVTATGVIAAACGGSGGAVTFGDGKDASISVGSDATIGFNNPTSDGSTNTSPCVKLTCAAMGYTCGTNADGCGGTVDCGTCTAPDMCGVAGFSKCGDPSVALDGGSASSCTSKSCSDLGFTCGMNADGCGKVIDCGTCTGNQTCGGGGTFSQCGGDITTTADGGPKCTALTCATLGNTCGQQGDGCGGLVGPCGTGTCTPPQFCGGGGVFNQCGGFNPNGADGGPLLGADGGPLLPPADDASTPPICVPITCASLGNTCGPQGDGCGGTIGPCGTTTTCTAPAYCGGGGYNKCGLPADAGVGSDGGILCTPITCATLGNTCGAQSDGCGGLVGPCGTTTCTYPAYCGGGGFNLCGGTSPTGADGGAICKPKACSDYGYACGQASDGCGGLTASCGTCSAPEYCGGGGTPYQCGGNVAADGATISSCVKATCTSMGWNCGYGGDGCGGSIGPCGGACPVGQVCGGAGVANVCGSTAACTNAYCAAQVACDSGQTTSISGTVLAGLQVSGQTAWNTGTPDPVPGVTVYIPTTGLTAFDTNPASPQISCNQCGADVSGNPLVSTTTLYNGTFTLANVPVGISFPLVIQLGHWRREFTIPAIPVTSECTTVPETGPFNMPSTSTQGDIPLTAISTGNWDAIECVLLKMGVAQSEFMSYSTWTGETSPDGGAPRKGRVHIYTSKTGGESFNRGPGAILAPQEDETVLMGSGTKAGVNGNYMMYDQILLPCWGDEFTGARSSAELANLISYGNGGGHFFATHFSYIWLHGNGALNGVANWGIGDNTNTGEAAFTGVVSQTVPPTVPVTNPGVFVEWLNDVKALTTNTVQPAAPPIPADVTIQQGRHDVNSVAETSTPWITGTDPNGSGQMLLHFTFDMPVEATADAGVTQCGHGIFSDFHVTVNGGTAAAQTTFPNECTAGTLSSQERILEYMIWDLASCVTPQTSTCTPKSCAQQGFSCGPASDGCGNLITGGCGTCTAPAVCGGGGTPYQCGLPDGGACTKQTCSAQGLNCGPAGDGCGGTWASCGTCPAGQTCGGGGTAGVCGAPDGGCASKSCSAQGFDCGPAGDGCGGTWASCGTCAAGQSCIANVCVTNPTDGGGGCVPLSCADQNIMCGPAGDGCGNLITNGCGTCPMGQTCGGGGVSGQCGAPPTSDASTSTGGCTPTPCAAQGLSCGPTGDGCGNIIQCGMCVTPQTCGGGGTPGMCGGNSNCTAQSCSSEGISCGPTGDGCGNLIQCGDCPAGQTCGGGGVNGQCGGGVTCMPLTCAQEGITCGPAGDGCGNTIASCGTCTPPTSCGGGGTPGVCGQSGQAQ